MTESPSARSVPDVAGPVTLSTGQTVHLPLELSATVAGAAFTASLGGVHELLPAGLTPIRVTRNRSVLVVVGVAARCAPASRWLRLVAPGDDRPGPGAVDVWGYPKPVADVSHESSEGVRRTTLRADGEHVLTLTVDRARTVPLSTSAHSYTVREGRLLREQVSLSGRVGGWPLTRGATLDLGEHWRADRLRSLDLGDRALVRFAGTVEGTIEPGEPIDAADP